MEVLYIEVLATYDGPEPCVGLSQEVAAKRRTGVVQAGLLTREIPSSGCRRPSDRRKATPPAALSRAVGGPRAGREPGHARKSPCSRTGRPCGRPCLSMMPRPGWLAGWQIGVVADRGGNAEAVIPQ